ncbi:MAG: MaoC family dehydratase [Tardiphaga sp.]
MNFLEDLQVGQTREFGSFTFTAESIKTFAREFDPQTFHLDEDAAKRSALFGGLAASGWHVASVSMGLRIRDAQRREAEAKARGEDYAAWGPSPGFRDLRWVKPVLVGDTITYASEVTDIRVSATRPGWGIMQASNTAKNQHGVLVMSFTASVFVPQRVTKG